MSVYKKYVFEIEMVVIPGVQEPDNIVKSFEDFLLGDLDPITLRINLREEEFERVLLPVSGDVD
jgi:hypothetical protein